MRCDREKKGKVKIWRINMKYRGIISRRERKKRKKKGSLPFCEDPTLGYKNKNTVPPLRPSSRDFK